MNYQLVKKMLSFPNAKINLGLNIVGKRPDGYHDIETIFYPIGIKDALEFVESPRVEPDMHISGIKVDGDINSNLVMKAYNLLKKDFSLPSLSIYLQKNIPFGAGLGGGSADAAFMLVMLNDSFNLQLSDLHLERYAAQLGSDCPFFIRNKPVFASGRGEVLEEINISLKGKYLVLVKPDIYVSTKDAYAGCKIGLPPVGLKSIATMPVEQWKDVMLNDFEHSVFQQFPAIEHIKDKLYQSGAIYASMSGSGSSVFGIFDEPRDLKSDFSGCFVWDGNLD
jgi:4-diphosphocytidyl-2-C-methyl-D-erythritol kinase